MAALVSAVDRETDVAALPPEGIPPRAKPDALIPWLIVLIGLMFMYVPTFVDLFRGLWSSGEQAHGPIVLAISGWLLYRKRTELLAAAVGQKGSWLGWPILAIGLLSYVVGRSQDTVLFEVGSFIWMLVGIVLLMLGTRSLKAAWFPFFFMMFMVPLPGVIVDALTMPMKIAVSNVVEHVLYAVGYPIARSGVVLQIGQYKLLVADACAGLHTLFTLESMGLLYMNLVQYQSVMRNTVLALLIVPISFVANIIRVIVLVLITYHFGDAAGQGFLHGFSGMVLFLSALLLIISADGFARTLSTKTRKNKSCNRMQQYVS